MTKLKLKLWQVPKNLNWEIWLKHSNCDKKKSRTRETPNLSTDADSSTNIFVSAGVKKGADSIRRRCRCRRLPRGFLGRRKIYIYGKEGGLTNERPQTDQVIWGPMRGLKKVDTYICIYTYMDIATTRPNRPLGRFCEKEFCDQPQKLNFLQLKNSNCHKT